MPKISSSRRRAVIADLASSIVRADGVAVATRLDKAGLSAREIADYLGHERISMTQDVYMTRKGDRGQREHCAGCLRTRKRG